MEFGSGHFHSIRCFFFKKNNGVHVHRGGVVSLLTSCTQYYSHRLLSETLNMTSTNSKLLTISFSLSGDPPVDYLTKKLQRNWNVPALLWDWRVENNGVVPSRQSHLFVYTPDTTSYPKNVLPMAREMSEIR